MLRIRTGSLIVVSILAGLAASGYGEEPNSKRALALELLEVSGGGDMAAEISQVMLASMQQNYAAMVKHLLDSQPSLTAEERDAIAKHLADYDAFSTRFVSEFTSAIDFDQLLEEVYVPLYEKHFTEDELRQLLAFQRSPLGQKSTKLIPLIMQEGMAGLVPRIQPILLEVAARILKEEQQVALAELGSQ